MKQSSLILTLRCEVPDLREAAAREGHDPGQPRLAVLGRKPLPEGAGGREPATGSTRVCAGQQCMRVVFSFPYTML